MLFKATVPLTLAAVNAVTGAPISSLTPCHEAGHDWSNVHIMTELSDIQDYAMKARFHAKYVVPSMTGAVGELFVHKNAGPVSFLNETGHHTMVHYLSFGVDVKKGYQAMTQPVIEPFVPSSDSLFDPIYLKSTPGKNRGPTGFPVHKKAELFQYYEDRGLVPVDKHFISWVVCEEQNYAFKLLWLHDAKVSVPADPSELPEQCASIRLKFVGGQAPPMNATS
ncbi:hypothetical protein IWZ01DRAFT_270567 [Phyllosticta capitalensis]